MWIGPTVDVARVNAVITETGSVISTVTACAASSAALDSRRTRSRPINVTIAPCRTSARAIAAPMPRPPPVTTACFPLRGPSDMDRHLRGARQIPLELLLPVQILWRPWHGAVAQLGCCVKGPERIGEMRSGQRAQIGAAGRDDAVHMVRLEDVAHRHRGDAHFVADAIRERGL